MFCSKCGKQIAEDANVCQYCGAPVAGKQPAPEQAPDQPIVLETAAEPAPQAEVAMPVEEIASPVADEQPTQEVGAGVIQGENKMAKIGFILSFFVPIVGLILSIIGLTRIKKYSISRKGMAIAGLVISAVQLIINAIMMPTIFAFYFELLSELFRELGIMAMAI